MASSGNWKPDPCQKTACQLQECLQRNHYQENRCLAALQRLVDCCKLWGEESQTVCAGISAGRDAGGDPAVLPEGDGPPGSGDWSLVGA